MLKKCTCTGTITLSTAHGTESKTISVTQLDKVSNYFYSVSENGSFGHNSSSDYNHKLATWAMELSYAAYNYPNGEELPIIPGAFMGDFTKTAGMLLEDNGFVNISEYNYTSDSRAAHTIGCRFVEFPGTRNLQSNNIGGNYNVHQHNGTNIQLPVRNLLDSVCIRDYDQGRADFRDNTLITGEDTEISTSHDDEIETKPLVVVDVRGSVTLSDWINDVMTQLDSENNRFAAFADEIFTNVENFYSVSENGSFGRNSSSDYNHKLATWAMELSYAAYNYPNGEELPIIPGAFMGDFTQTAGMLLEDNGFVNISEYNYTSDSRAAHTIGWRPVEVDVSETSQIINDVGGMDNVYQYNIDDKGSVLYNLLDQLRVDRSAHLFDERRDTGADRYDSITNSQSFAAGNKILKPLLVVDIRGSVTWWDWVNDIGAQALPFNNRFAALAEEVLTNVENFYSVSENGSFGRNSSSDYNHKFATWAMELSYAAYNYPNGEELPIIPGAFMGDFTQTAGALLEDNGFVRVLELNYESDNRAAHTIGFGSVEFLGTSNLQSNNIGGNYNVHQHNGTNIQLPVRDLCDSVCAYECNTRRSNSGNPEIMDGNVDVLEVSESQLTTTTVKNLVVIDVRGSVTLSDWGNDIVTQLAANNNRFEALADEVFTNAIRYMNAAGVLGLNPIVLITGHSMGAAIANILAARFNEAMDPDNIYAYTFATPRTVNEAVSGNQAVNYPNIFNILNSNDAVTYVPSSFFSIEEHWRRHGIDLYINMPYSESNDTDLSGMLCHAMPVYLNWLNSSEDLSLQEMLTLSEEARVRGLLPIIVKIKCPVGVTIKDSNGNIIGYESQQENAVYPDMLNRGVVSWIEEDGAKMFFIPSIADAASIEIEAYDYGSMNFTVGSVDASTESEIKTLNNISLYPGKEFIADISEDVPVEDTQLFITENGETVGEVTETNPHLKGVTVEHVEKNGQIVTYKHFVTDNTVTEIRYIRVDPVSNITSTSYLTPELSVVEIEEDGDNLIWTRGDCYLVAGDYVYDVVVNSNGEWYTYENALHVHVPQEYADINKEYFSSNATPTNTATIPAAVPYYTVIDPTDN